VVREAPAVGIWITRPGASTLASEGSGPGEAGGVAKAGVTIKATTPREETIRHAVATRVAIDDGSRFVT
jgi:hypothetical protein